MNETLKRAQAETYQRDFKLARKTIDEEARTVELAFSSEEPYGRSWGTEILDHSPKSMRLGRLQNGGAVLVDHDHRDHVGVVEDVRIDSDKVARATVRFGKSQRASEIFQDIVDGIRTLVSVGYRIHSMKLESEREDEAVYRVDDWEPFEISMVSVPADPTVGVGRSDTETQNIIEVKEETKMTDQVKADAPKIDVAAENQRAVAQERSRVAEIRKVAEKLGKTDLADNFIANGGSVDDFRKAVLEEISQAPLQKATESTEIGLTDSEKRKYSFTRLMNALANPTDRRAQEAAAFEFECSNAFAKQTGRESRGALVPDDVLQARDLTVGVAADGGDLVSTDLLSGSFIEKLENAMAISGLGATMLYGLVGNIAIPRQTGGATAYWLAENGAPTESQQAVDQVAMTPKTVGAFTEYSRKLLQQSSISVEQFVRNDLALRLALELDRAAIHGTGASNQPTGIVNVAGIGDVAGGANGAAPTYDHMVDLESLVSVANAAVGNLSYLSNAKMRGKLKKTQQFSGTNGRSVFESLDYPFAVSNQVRSDLDKGTSTGVCSAIVFGNWRDLVCGFWGGLDLQVNPYSLDTTGAVRITAFQDCDIAVRHPESFAAMLDALE